MPEEKYMRRAIELAKKGSGHVNPNPLVGAVIVKDGEIIGEGYHECYGQLHAERNAIANARKRGNNIEGSTIYVTLEQCALCAVPNASFTNTSQREASSLLNSSPFFVSSAR